MAGYNTRHQPNQYQEIPEQSSGKPGILSYFSNLWSSSSSKESLPKTASTVAAERCVEGYCSSYQKCTDIQSQLQVLQCMLPIFSEQLKQALDILIRNSNESLKLKTENSQLKMKVEELTREVQSLDRQLKGARGRKVANAEKRGILPNEDRKSLEPLVKVYFNQKVTAFADEYGEQAAEKRKVFTSCFIHAFKEAARVLGESMVKYWNEHEDDSALSPLRAMNISSSDALVKAVISVHSSSFYDHGRREVNWTLYKAIMEVKSNMVTCDQSSLVMNIQDRVSKIFTKLQSDPMLFKTEQIASHQPRDRISTKTNVKSKGKIDSDNQRKSREISHTGQPCVPPRDHSSSSNSQTTTVHATASTKVNKVDEFISNTLEILIKMLLSSNPLIPCTSDFSEVFDGAYVTAEASEWPTGALAGRKIRVFYSPILLAPAPGTTTVRVFQKGIVEVEN